MHKSTCLACSAEFDSKRPSKACSRKCRDKMRGGGARCTGCSQPMGKFSGSSTEPWCKPCRSAGLSIKHGTSYAYSEGCRCEVCKANKNAEMRAYNAMVRERDGVSSTAQYKRKLKGQDPMAEQVYPPCFICGESLINPSRSERPMHKSCRDTPEWVREGLPDPAIEREELRAERERKAAEYKAKDHRSDIRAGYEDGDFDRFMRGLRKRTNLTDSGCMEWQGQIKGGYASVKIGRVTVGVHRLSLEAKEGKPLGVLAAHHICANSICVNPAHLQPVTQRENTAEMLARTSLEDRIEELERALRSVAPEHEALNRISHKQAS